MDKLVRKTTTGGGGEKGLGANLRVSVPRIWRCGRDWGILTQLLHLFENGPEASASGCLVLETPVLSKAIKVDLGNRSHC